MPGQATFTPGAIYHYVRFNNQSTAYFLGTAVTAPRASKEKYEIPVLNDIGGRSARFQSVQDGNEWKISTTLNRFDLNLCRSLRFLDSGVAPTVPATSGPPLGTAIGTLGTETGYARGTLVIGVSDFELILVNAYAGTPASGLPNLGSLDMATARTYYACSVMGYDESTEGTRVLEVAMAIQSRNVFNLTTDQETRGFFGYSEATPANLGTLG